MRDIGAKYLDAGVINYEPMRCGDAAINGRLSVQGLFTTTTASFVIGSVTQTVAVAAITAMPINSICVIGDGTRNMIGQVTGVAALNLTVATIAIVGGAAGQTMLSGANVQFFGYGATIALGAVGGTPNANAATLIAGILALQTGNGSFPGVLSAADWNTFNNKQATLLAASISQSGYLLSTDFIRFTQGGLAYTEWLVSGTVVSNTSNLIRTNALAMVLPAAAGFGDVCEFIMGNSLFTLTVDPQTLLIEGVAGVMTHDVFKADGRLSPFALRYTNAINGWKFL